jgi:hypothetical protein
VVTGRDKMAVETYVAEHNLTTPDPMSAKGQSQLATIDPVISEVQGLLRTLDGDEYKKNPYLGASYVQYKLGRSTPYNDLFTNLSFEGLRSGSAALQGMNSRAYPIIKKAFEHVPTLDRGFGALPDTVPLMRDKLKTVLGLLQDGRKAVLDDERKSGIVKDDKVPEGRVLVRSKDGQVGHVPKSQLAQAIAEGYVEVKDGK